jgi:hypothetical protein
LIDWHIVKESKANRNPNLKVNYCSSLAGGTVITSPPTSGSNKRDARSASTRRKTMGSVAIIMMSPPLRPAVSLQRQLPKILLLLLILLCILPDKSHAAKHHKATKADYLYSVMSNEDYVPIIEYAPPKNNQTLNEVGIPELDNPSFLYSQRWPVARIVEFYGKRAGWPWN